MDDRHIHEHRGLYSDGDGLYQNVSGRRAFDGFHALEGLQASDGRQAGDVLEVVVAAAAFPEEAAVLQLFRRDFQLRPWRHRAALNRARQILKNKSRLH
ncbi:MAG: hypothetical protein ACREQ5_06840, partial [Candidatus Dormibacteria bacterium]